MSKDELFRALRARGVARAVAHFSGGNDEGGVDSFQFLGPKGEEVTTPGTVWLVEVTDYELQWDNMGGGPFKVGDIVLATDEQEDYTTKRYEWTAPDGVTRVREPRAAKRTIYRPATAEEIEVARLFAALEKPVQDTYGSFAGEFYVHGEVVADVALRQLKMERNEQSGYDYSEEYY